GIETGERLAGSIERNAHRRPRDHERRAVEQRHLERKPGAREIERRTLVELDRVHGRDEARPALRASGADARLRRRDPAFGGGKREITLERDAPRVLERLGLRNREPEGREQREKPGPSHERAVSARARYRSPGPESNPT